jgi:hypothetical protein
MRSIGGRTFRGLGVAVAALAVAALAGAQPATWSQERVTALGAELYDDVKELKITVQKNPDMPIGGARRAQYEARDQLRVLQNLAQHLRNDLQNGAGREETISTFKRIQVARRDLEELGRKASIRENTMEKVMEVQDVLRRLGPYYEEGGEARGGAGGA